MPAGFGKLDRRGSGRCWGGCWGRGKANIAGIFSFALLQRGKIHELVCHFSTFPADAATREFFLQTCEYRSESCYITGSSAPVWMDVASLLMERFSSVLSCSVGKRTWRRWEGWEEGGGGGRGWGRLFSRISSCGGDEIGILSALVTFGSHAEGNPVSSLTCSVMSESHCSTAEMHIFENCTTNIGFQRAPVSTTVATRSLALKSNLRHLRKNDTMFVET